MTKTSYQVVLEYWGFRYYGWQKQKDQNLLTVQGELEKALKKISQSENVYTIASGRTDAGVHARGQVVRIDLEVPIPKENLARAVNNLLPSDIKIVSVKKCRPDFHPQKQAISKEYHYHFSAHKAEASVFQGLLVAELKGEIDISLMHKACELFLGEHEFLHFYCVGTPVRSYFRKIYKCEIVKVIGYLGMINEHYVLKIEGSGFLKQMVRLIMGAIWAVGQGQVTLKQLKTSLENPEQIEKRHLAPLAPAKGLYLHHVSY